MISKKDREILAEQGWSIIREKPLMITDSIFSTATGIAAAIVVSHCIGLHNRMNELKKIKKGIKTAVRRINKIDGSAKDLEELCKH